jgi:hypothetical protein
VTVDGIWIGDSIIDDLYTHNSWLHFTDHWHTQTSVLSVLQSPLAVSWQRILTQAVTVSLNYTHQISHKVITAALSTNYIPGWRPFHTSLLVFSSQPNFQLSTLAVELLPTTLATNSFLHSSPYRTELSTQSQSQNHIATDGQSVSLVSSLGAHEQIFVTAWQLGLVFVGRPLWREDGSDFCVCCWALPAQSYLGPSPRDHILLSQIWDFPFRRLRLARSRWRFPAPPADLLPTSQEGLCRSIAQVVSYRFQNSVTQVRSKVRWCGIYGGQLYIGTDVLVSILVSPANLYLINALDIHTYSYWRYIVPILTGSLSNQVREERPCSMEL